MKNLTIININPGNIVLCDLCNKDYTNSKEVGGMLFQSTAVCPDCLDEFMLSVRKYKEEKFIKAVAMPNETFRDFVYRIRKWT